MVPDPFGSVAPASPGRLGSSLLQHWARRSPGELDHRHDKQDDQRQADDHLSCWAIPGDQYERCYSNDGDPRHPLVGVDPRAMEPLRKPAFWAPPRSQPICSVPYGS
jgi:hypothetical protein